ncbi:MAG: PAS domain S-box protein, partial [Pseudomonadota bacterium]
MAAVLPERTLLDAYTRPADRRQFVRAIPVVVILIALFAAAVPFVSVQVGPLPAFVPIYQSVLIVNDLITAVFMFGLARASGSRALLVLATGYVFTAFAATVHLLTFPGVFSLTGLLGAGEQSTAWLYMFWHAGFPLFVIGYAVIDKRSAREMSVSRLSIAGYTAAALAVVCAFALLATSGAGGLPSIMKGNYYAPMYKAVISTVVALIVLAAGTLWFKRPRTVLDLWLLVVLCAWLFDVATAATLNAGRYDVGFYLGRIYGLLAASFVLGVLIIEHLRVYADLVQANATARRHTAEMMAVAAEKAALAEKERVQKEAAERLRESEERFRALADNIAQLAWMADESGSLFWYNQRWYDYTGTRLDEMKEWGWQSVHHPDHLRRVVDKFREHVKAAEPWEDTFPLRARDGSFRWFLSRAVPIRGEDGRVHLWFGTNTDITEQRLAQEALGASEERFRQLSDAMPQLVWTSNAGGVVDYYNQRASEYAGLERVSDGSWAWASVLHESDTAATTTAWRDAVTESTGYEIEHRLKMRDGSFRWHLSRARPMRDESGAVVRWFGTATDIHAQKEAEEALRKADRMKNAFLATLAHELRNPLAPILNAVQILRLARHASPEKGRPLEIIDNQ